MPPSRRPLASRPGSAHRRSQLPHSGTAWLHDNSLIAAGLARYGFRDDANRIAVAMIEASTHFRWRLPEVFAGYPREQPSSGRVPDGVAPAGLGDRSATAPAHDADETVKTQSAGC
jgi:hypothetical protein